MAKPDIDLGAYKLGWSDHVDYAITPKKGLNIDVVNEISHAKSEPKWMRDFRLKSLERFEKKPMLPWFADNMPDIDFDDIYYYLKPTNKQVSEWDELPEEMKATYEKLGLPEAEQKYLAGVTAQYECLRGDTRVWTQEGMKPIKTVLPGDVVFALNEETGEIERAAVVGGGCSGEKEILEVSLQGRTIGASSDHPFLVLRDIRKPGHKMAKFEKQWIPASDLVVGDLVAVPRDIPDYGESWELTPVDSIAASSKRESFSHPRTSNSDLLWLIGLFIGDGYFKESEGYVTVQFAVNNEDSGVNNEIIRIAYEQFGLNFRLAPDGYRLHARGATSLAEFFMINGIQGNSHTKRIPYWVYSLPLAQRLAFLAGYIDADGAVRSNQKNKDITVTSVNESLLQDVRELADLCGINSRNATPFYRNKDGLKVLCGYRMSLSGDFDKIPLKSTTKKNRLARRKYHHSYTSAKGATFRAHTTDTLGFRRVVSIDNAGRELTYDIEVAGHHNFVAEGFVVHNSEVVMHKNMAELEEKGIIFCSMDEALREHEDIVKEHFATIIPPGDNKFAALNSAVWSGGSFVYVPPGVDVGMPLQAYFRINSENAGQFERTLIIADEGSNVHYVEGCSAPVYSSDSLHSAVVELVAKKDATIQYTTIQNWSPNVYNLVTKRAEAQENATVKWVDGNLGSKLTMKYPGVVLTGRKAHGEVLSVAYAGKDQHQDAGAKMTHAAPETTSVIDSKSISKDGGRTTYRGLVRVEEGAHDVKSHVRCDALILDEESRSDTYPYMEVEEKDARIGHEATVSKVGDAYLFYLMSRGLSEQQATAMIVNGFIEPIVSILPMEYAVEMTRLIEVSMEDSVG